MLFESYIHRLLALLFFFVVVAFVDYYLKGTKSVKWRQYLTLISIAIAFSLFGAVHDQVVHNVIPVGVCAFFFLLIGAVVGYITHLLGYKVISTGNAAFLIVWGWHIGLYLGALLGLIYVVKKRKNT